MFLFFLFINIILVIAQRGSAARASAAFATSQNQIESNLGWSAPAGAAISIEGRNHHINHPPPAPTYVAWSGCSLGVCESRTVLPVNPPMHIPEPPPFKPYVPLSFPSPPSPPYEYKAPSYSPSNSPSLGSTRTYGDPYYKKF